MAKPKKSKEMKIDYQNKPMQRFPQWELMAKTKCHQELMQIEVGEKTIKLNKKMTNELPHCR